jgi:hypothetical protein
MRRARRPRCARCGRRAFAAGALTFRDRGSNGWSEADERGFLDRIVVPGHTEAHTVDLRQFGGTLSTVTTFVPGNEEWAACTLDVYQKYFPSYDDWADASDDSPTLLKADAAAQRMCD